MTNRTIEERCNFDTKRLSVSSWTNQVKGLDSEINFAEKVTEILSPNVTKALPDGWQSIDTINGAQEWINERNKESHFVTIQLSTTNERVGFIFLYESDSEHEFHDLRFGYLLSEKVWGKGLGTELIEGLIKWCKKEGNIKLISGGVETDNIGSIKVLEKTGFSASTVDNQTEGVIFYEYQFDIEETYDDDVYSNNENLFGHPYQELQDYFKDYPQKGSVLDLGCGQGRDSFYFSSLGFQVTAVDNSVTGIRQLINKSKDLKIDINGIVSDVFEFKTSNKFDVILFDMLLHSFKDNEQKGLLNKYADNLEANGIFCIVYPEELNSEHFMQIFEELIGNWELKNKIKIYDVPMLEKDNEFTFEMIIIRNNVL
jgi:ribosomal-protein-alanine N-acetyltransferase